MLFPMAEPPRLIDLDQDTRRQVVVDREEGQYLGHVSTVLLENGRTILAAYPKGHGKGAILLKRSDDGGKTWSDRLPTPANWTTSQETPVLHRMGKTLLLFSGLYPARIARSEDEGATWSELSPMGNWGGIVVMGSTFETRDGLRALFHDDGRFFRNEGKATGTFTMYATLSKDRGLTWSEPVAFQSSDKLHLCEPGAIWSPDGRTLGLFLRENKRTGGSYWMTSRNQGRTWSSPALLPWWFEGDRHTVKPLGGGRYLVSYRFMKKGHAWQGDWVAWVGTWKDITTGGGGEALIRLKDNQDSWDCAYPGVEILPGGDAVLTTYGHWEKGKPPYILSVRLQSSELAPRFELLR